MMKKNYNLAKKVDKYILKLFKRKKFEFREYEYKYELKKWTVEKIVDTKQGNCIEFYFKEVGYVLCDRRDLDKEVLSTLGPGSAILAKIDQAPIPGVHELYLLRLLYKKNLEN